MHMLKNEKPYVAYLRIVPGAQVAAGNTVVDCIRLGNLSIIS